MGKKNKTIKLENAESQKCLVETKYFFLVIILVVQNNITEIKLDSLIKLLILFFILKKVKNKTKYFKLYGKFIVYRKICLLNNILFL